MTRPPNPGGTDDPRPPDDVPVEEPIEEEPIAPVPQIVDIHRDVVTSIDIGPVEIPAMERPSTRFGFEERKNRARLSERRRPSRIPRT